MAVPRDQGHAADVLQLLRTLSKKVLAVVSPNNSIVWSLLRLVWYGKACGDLVKENQVKPIIDQHTSEFVNSTLIPKKVSISR